MWQILGKNKKKSGSSKEIRHYYYYYYYFDPLDCSPPGSTIHGIFQARILSRLPFPSLGDLPDPGIKPMPPELAGGLFTYFRSVQFNWLVMSDSLQPHGLQHARPPCPSPIPRAYSNSCLLSWWCHPNISSSVIPFSSRPQSFPASGSFQMSQFFTSGGQSIGVSASALVLPMNIQDWFLLGFAYLAHL